MGIYNLSEVFKNSVHISNSLKSIRSLFLLNDEKRKCLNYSPPYQRNYVWSETKATFFIETLLLHAEFPPIVIYEKNGMYEVIDGRQRCETIDLFLNDKLCLKGTGLDQLWYLANKKFSHLSLELRERIENATIRVIIVRINNDENINPDIEELVKREIFKRYNMGISPLKKEDVFKAQYLQDKINLFFKKCFQQNQQLYNHVTEIFDHKKSLEALMQNIRQLLVLHRIPISRFINERDDIVNKYYDYLSFENTETENIQSIFNNFKEKIFFLLEIKTSLNKAGVISNRLIFECLYWALSICEVEKVKFDKINHPAFKSRLVKDIAKNIKAYQIQKNNFGQHIKDRYYSTASFFSHHLNLSFNTYLKSSKEFFVAHKECFKKYMQERYMPGLEQDYFSKVTPTSITIIDVIDKMRRKKFNLRPPYQRNEEMNILKASSLVESILLNFKLHPIYIYLRKDGVSEVIDGQQRLLAILGFMGEEFRNEHGNMARSEKDCFALDLKSNLLDGLKGNRFKDLSEQQKELIRNYDIDIIEIKEEDNKHLKPEELFKRLNYKPYPIKENTFEFWNSYIDNRITNTVKGIYDNNKWLYLRKFDKRMLNEELIICLLYLDYMTNKDTKSIDTIKQVLSIYKWQTQITVKIKNKAHITRILENKVMREELLKSCQYFEMNFIEKVKELISNANSNNADISRSRRLDSILRTGVIRVIMNFYLLWAALKNVQIDSIKNSKAVVKNNINKIFDLIINDYGTAEELESAIIESWDIGSHYKKLTVK